MNAGVAFVLATTTAAVGCLFAHVAAGHLMSGRVLARFPRDERRSGTFSSLTTGWIDGLVPSRRLRRVDNGLPAWLDGAARAARAGASLRDALLDGASIARDRAVGVYLASFVDALRQGATLREALGALEGERSSARDLVLRALRLAAETGGPSASILDAVSSTLHERTQLAREVRALASQARASATVMAIAPVVFAAGAMAADPRVGEFLGSGPGLVCVTVGAVLDAAGAVWMARLVRPPT